MIAIPVSNNSKNPDIDDRFGRCSMFCIINVNNEYRIIENSGKNLGSGAGAHVVKLLVDGNVNTIISPHIGPKAMTAIKALDLKVFHVGDAKTVAEALELLLSNKLEMVKDPKPGLRKV